MSAKDRVGAEPERGPHRFEERQDLLQPLPRSDGNVRAAFPGHAIRLGGILRAVFLHEVLLLACVYGQPREGGEGQGRARRAGS